MISAHFRKLVFQSPCPGSQVFRSRFVISFLSQKRVAAEEGKRKGLVMALIRVPLRLSKVCEGGQRILKSSFVVMMV